MAKQPALTPEQNEVLRALLRRVLRESGAAQRVLGRLIGVSQATLWSFLNGDSGLGLATATTLAEHAGTTLKALLESATDDHVLELQRSLMREAKRLEEKVEKATTRDRVRSAMTRRLLDVGELAKRAGISTRVLSGFLKHGRAVNEGEIESIARALNVSPVWLATGEFDPQRPAELLMVPDGDARPSLSAEPNVSAMADELAQERPDLAPYIPLVLQSGSMRSLDIPLTRAALEALAMVVQRHSQRRMR